ncbi:nucleosome-remodeling factor subunit NURF301-like [Mercenaria mercenaria]|uniref:nucleosome-remodeling factor subunit NURF301-like n=1 Tax=Mercenaria mercenaria TaxID=6596 RepID=UPI00234E84BD|nr:nucleosome-remodeling factor subunit NURF301-like [Mercenaria mercenaria]
MNLGMEHITAHDLMKCRRRVAEKVMVFEDFMTDCCPKCGFVIEDDNKMQCGNCRRMYHFKPYCIEDSVLEMQDEDENFTCKLCALNFWPKIHPQVTKEASLEHTVHWTSKDEIQKKLKERRQLDTDVVFIDNIETSTGSGDWSAKQTKVDEKTSPVFSHRKTRLLKRKRQRSSFIYPPVTKKSRTYCVCNTVDDGRLYWNCDLCEKWYHPSCLGRDDKEEPEVFVCNTSVCKRVLESAEGFELTSLLYSCRWC